MTIAIAANNCKTKQLFEKMRKIERINLLISENKLFHERFGISDN